MADKGYRSKYLHGSVAPDYDVRTAIEEAPGRPLHERVHREHEKAIGLNFGYLAFIVFAIIVSVLFVVQYLSIQASNITASERLADLKSEYRAMSLKNDETYERIVDSVDLMEVKRVAMVEMGMVYAGEDQIITYESNDSDYVKQYMLIP